MPSEVNQYNKALNCAFRLLKLRLRSSQEIRDKLRIKGYEQGIIDNVLDKLEELKFIDDKVFSLAWAKSKINNSYGLNRINFELKNKGISKDIISSTINALKPDYNEVNVINELIEKRVKRLKNLDKLKIRQRLYSFLRLRGFSSQAIIEALNRL